MQLATIFCFVLTKAPEKLLQVTLECDGVTIHGNIARISSYPEHIANVQPITVIGQFAYFSASSNYAEHGGFFRCFLEAGEVLSVLSNSASPPSEVRKISTYDTSFISTDRKANE